MHPLLNLFSLQIDLSAVNIVNLNHDFPKYFMFLAECSSSFSDFERSWPKVRNVSLLKVSKVQWLRICRINRLLRVGKHTVRLWGLLCFHTVIVFKVHPLRQIIKLLVDWNTCLLHSAALAKWLAGFLLWIKFVCFLGGFLCVFSIYNVLPFDNYLLPPDQADSVTRLGSLEPLPYNSCNI